MDLTHYVAVKAIESEATPVSVLLSKILITAHVVAARRFGVAFPSASVGQGKPVSTPEGGYRSSAEETESYRLAQLSAKPSLGDTIQFFSGKDVAWLINEAINGMPRGMKEFIDIGMPKPIPEGTRFVSYKRARNAVRTESTIQRELRRTIKRHPDDPAVQSQEALADRRKTIVERSRLPYMSVFSRSSGQEFSIRFEVEVSDEPKDGQFDGYGFGLKRGQDLQEWATVPLIEP